jgi:cytochrome c oxidase subunit IV
MADHAKHDDHDSEGMGHPLPAWMLLAVFGALIVFTVLTVSVTKVDLGGQGNFVVAMVIATIKAALVMAVFMHLVWDNRLNVLIFLSSFLFVSLFLTMALTDRQEYQKLIDNFEQTKAAQAAQ